MNGWCSEVMIDQIAMQDILSHMTYLHASVHPFLLG